jgi:hypothetical protein
MKNPVLRFVGSIWGLASGLTAALAMTYLNVSWQYHDTNTVLLFMFGAGALLIFAFFQADLFWPNAREFYYLLLCGGSGVAGQFLLTIGYRYVTAVDGGIISSTRILLAALPGPFVVGELPLDATGWDGCAAFIRGEYGAGGAQGAEISGDVLAQMKCRACALRLIYESKTIWKNIRVTIINSVRTLPEQTATTHLRVKKEGYGGGYRQRLKSRAIEWMTAQWRISGRGQFKISAILSDRVCML